VSCWTPFAVPLPVRSPLPSPPHWSLCALDTTRLPDCIPHTHASRTQHTPHTTHPLPHRRTVRMRHPPTAASLRCRRSRGGGVRGPPLPPSSSPSPQLPPPPSPPPPPPSLPPPITSAALRLQEASAITCVPERVACAQPSPAHLSSLCAVFANTARRSRRCLRFARLCATKNLCKLQRKLVSNRKSKEWSMLGSGKHFAIGEKEARRVWYLRVDCACCPQ
jgi:hypothetical protein